MMKNHPDQYSRKRNIRYSRYRRGYRYCLMIGAASLVLGVVLSVRIAGLPDPVQAQIDILPDEHARDGVLKAGSGTPMEEGQYWVVLNQLPTMETGNRECNIEFENPIENRYGSRINLYLKSTGERIGGTRLVSPGKYVETLILEKDLEEGEHPVLANIELFHGEEPAGGVTLELTVRVTGQ